MPSTDFVTVRSSRKFGLIQIISTSLSRQLLGFVLGFIGIQLMSWAIDGNTALASEIIYVAIGRFCS